MSTDLIIVRSPSVLSTTTGALTTFSTLLGSKHSGIRKIGPRELELPFRGHVPEAIDILRETLKRAPSHEARQVWYRCKKELCYELLMSDDRTFDFEIYQRFLLQPVFAARAFLYHHRGLRDTPYGRSFIQFDGDVVPRFANLLSILPKKLAVDIVRATNRKVLYLLYVWEFDEVDRYDDPLSEVGEATSWLRNGSPPSISETPFLFWLWENDYDLYVEMLVEFFNPEYIEMRELFYEVLQRTQNWREYQDQFADPTVDDIVHWLNDEN